MGQVCEWAPTQAGQAPRQGSATPARLYHVAARTGPPQPSGGHAVITFLKALHLRQLRRLHQCLHRNTTGWGLSSSYWSQFWRPGRPRSKRQPIPFRGGGGGAETATSPPQPHMLLFLCGHQCHRGARPSFSDPDYLAKAHPQVVLGPPSRSGGQRGCPNVKCVS